MSAIYWLGDEWAFEIKWDTQVEGMARADMICFVAAQAAFVTAGAGHAQPAS